MSSSDAVTGENVSYAYDALNRLIAATTTNTSGPVWGNSYSYDGFGNLTAKTVTQGTAPSAAPQVNSATNQARMIGDNGFDANGNWGGPNGSQEFAWNVENQLISTGGSPSNGNPTYTYDPWGKRVLQYAVSSTYGPSGTLFFYGITGQLLGTYGVTYVTSSAPPGGGPEYLYFGNRLLAPADRLGSVRNNASGSGSNAYYPWGEERLATSEDTFKFATYFRDGVVGTAPASVMQDYANARYYNNNFGRFWSPDPGGVKTADPKNPQSWNRYAYVNDDPVNFSDPGGGCALWADPAENGDADANYCLVFGSMTPGIFHAIQETNSGPGQGPVGTFNRSMQSMTQQALQNLGPGCRQVFGSTSLTIGPPGTLGGPQLNVLAALGQTSNLYFYDLRASGNLTLTQAGIVSPSGQPYSPNLTLAAYFGDPTQATAETVNNIILLGPLFFSSSAAWQNTTLVHEDLHAVFAGTVVGNTDVDIADYFNLQYDRSLSGNQLVNAASYAISAWLNSDCGGVK
jgi:RHS repeat-associated protein